MYVIFVLILFISFLLALWSLYQERQTTELQKITSDYRKTQIKGTIILDKDRQAKHYSSYSG